MTVTSDLHQATGWGRLLKPIYMGLNQYKTSLKKIPMNFLNNWSFIYKTILTATCLLQDATFYNFSLKARRMGSKITKYK